MAKFGIQKRGTSPILAKRKKFKDGSYPLMNEVSAPKMERKLLNEHPHPKNHQSPIPRL